MRTPLLLGIRAWQEARQPVLAEGTEVILDNGQSGTLGAWTKSNRVNPRLGVSLSRETMGHTEDF
jgi:hypothetical protein